LPSGHYAVISEANVYGYSGMSFAAEAADQRLSTEFLDDET